MNKIARQIMLIPIIFFIGNRLLNEFADEIRPNRLNRTWYGLPYIGRTYIK